jgi:hypothetical protein
MRRKPAGTPARPRPHGAWIVDGVRYEFIRIRPRDMFGIADVWVDARTQVPMLDRERALLDAYVHLRGFGAGGLGDQVLAEHLRELDTDRLLRYAKQMGRPRVSARVESALARAAGSQSAPV